jgi:hypothetical protein
MMSRMKSWREPEAGVLGDGMIGQF